MTMYRTLSWSLLALGVGLTGCFDSLNSNDSAATGNATSAKNGGIRGAIFTTTVDGTRVNANIYPSKDAVYLDGGPRGGSPSTAAALSAGDYFFQVTDPSGKHLLSSDHISCRKIHVSDDGVIVQVYAGTTYTRQGNTYTPSACQHQTGIDSDHAALGAITVQLMPYLDTPNNGGEYKVWVTPVAQYTGDPAYVPSQGDGNNINGTDRKGGNSYGFESRFSKTDNFKIKNVDEDEVPVCGDGVVDEGEQCDDGNATNGDGCTSTCTPEEVVPPCCGDGVTEGTEQCDDGNSTNGDGCSATCELEVPVCGNHVVENGEACDDGNTANGDGCSALCQVEPPPPPPAPCCGDGHVDAGEACDDGNTADGDGCSATCQIELPPPPPPPAPCCGDGHVDAGETCDDGNTVGGDGCSSVCLLETTCTEGHTCPIYRLK